MRKIRTVHRLGENYQHADAWAYDMREHLYNIARSREVVLAWTNMDGQILSGLKTARRSSDYFLIYMRNADLYKAQGIQDRYSGWTEGSHM